MIRVIRREQLLEKQNRYIDSGFGTPAPDHLVWIEVGPIQNYDRLHIQKAIHLTERQIRDGAHEVIPSPASEIVLYCSKGDEPRLWYAAAGLSCQGYGNLYLYVDGKDDWTDEDLFSVSSLVPADRVTRAA